jgi:transposase
MALVGVRGLGDISSERGVFVRCSPHLKSAPCSRMPNRRGSAKVCPRKPLGHMDGNDAHGSEPDSKPRSARRVRKARSFSCWTQFACLAYAQLSRQTSLRDLELALETTRAFLYHCFGAHQVRRSTLADANETRRHQIYEALFVKLYQQCAIQAPEHRFRFRRTLYSFDASVIDLCLSVFPWAKFRTTKGAIKLHALLDHDGHIPSFVRVTTGSTHDIHQARNLVLEPDSLVAFDRGYVDYAWFYQLHLQHAFFVTRLKRGAAFRVLARRDPPPLTGVTSDQTIRITGSKADSIPIDLRRIGYLDPATGCRYFFLTNLFELSPKTIAEIYRARWQVELFFKWIKQDLRIKTFLGTSPNAVMSQVYVAMTTYLLLSYLKFSSRSPLTLYALAKRL